MGIDNKSGSNHFAKAIILVCGVFVAHIIGSDWNMNFSPAYLLVILYLLWLPGRGNQFYYLGVLTSILVILGFFLTTTPETRTLNLLYFNLILIILVWVVIYFVYRQKMLVERLGKNNEQLSAMFENATEGILLVNNEGKIVILNPFAEGLFGYGRMELVGQPVEKLIPERFSKRHSTHRTAYHKDPHNRPMGTGMELFALHRSGREFPVEVSLGHYAEEGRQTIIVFVNDITERNKAKKQLIIEKELSQKLNEELEVRVLERTRKLEDALSKLEKSNKSLIKIEKDLSIALNKERELGELKSRFVAMASHEFRTPLTTILSSVFLLENSKEEDKQRVSTAHLAKIRKSVKNMTTILNDILSLSKLEENKLMPSYGIVDIKSLAEEIIEEFHLLKKPDQVISYSHCGSGDSQIGDKQFLRNILINLLSNAIKFSPIDGIISLYTEIENAQLKIIVSDCGIGIPEEEQQHLFTSFFRAGNAQNIDGTGLGLNIVKKYVDLMHGNIELKSGVNQGTTFIVSVPIPKDVLQIVEK